MRVGLTAHTVGHADQQEVRRVGPGNQPQPHGVLPGFPVVAMVVPAQRRGAYREIGKVGAVDGGIRCQSESHTRSVGHVEAVGDAFPCVECGYRSSPAFDDVVDAALVDAGGGGELCLACSVLLGELEESSGVTFAEDSACGGLVPDVVWDVDRAGRPLSHRGRLRAMRRWCRELQAA